MTRPIEIAMMATLTSALMAVFNFVTLISLCAMHLDPAFAQCHSTSPPGWALAWVGGSVLAFGVVVLTGAWREILKRK